MPEVRRRKLLSIAAGLAAAPFTAKASPLATLTPTVSTAQSVAVYPVDVPPANLISGTADAVKYTLGLSNLHTKEKIVLNFGRDLRVTDAMEKTFNRFLRDHYSGAVRNMDPDLIQHLLELQMSLDVSHSEFEVISGYRSPATNEMLRKRGARVARKSLHMSGRAVDIRMAGVKLDNLRDAALDLKAGGVGFYRRSSFLHLDTGRVRRW